MRFGVRPSSPLPGEKVGAALTGRTGVWPLNGLRHPPAADTCGWYLWAGEFEEADDFFEPLHVEHLADWRKLVVPYLALPPGWRFLVAPGVEDVWYDEKLLQVLRPGTRW